AEDGIRDFHVTGVQTCALPISFSGIRAEIAERAEVGVHAETRREGSGRRAPCPPRRRATLHRRNTKGRLAAGTHLCVSAPLREPALLPPRSLRALREHSIARNRHDRSPPTGAARKSHDRHMKAQS